MSDTLKFPSGKFTHTELALHNGKTNQQVWTAYQAAIKDGTIISAGERPNASGKGKPSKLWEVNPNKGVATTPLTQAPTPVVQKVQAEPRVKRQPKPEVVQPTKVEPEKVVETKLATVEPTKPPVVEAEPEVEEVRRPMMVNTLQSQIETLEETCPFCNTRLLCVRGDGRVKVWCGVNDLKICKCSENPYGVAKNVKDAIQVLHDKYVKNK